MTFFKFVSFLGMVHVLGCDKECKFLMVTSKAIISFITFLYNSFIGIVPYLGLAKEGAHS
jgi:hypothetical protein